MKITLDLDRKITHAVQTSMRIEGYTQQPTAAIKRKIQRLMTQHHVKVSVQRK